jgi:hypothetical protein
MVQNRAIGSRQQISGALKGLSKISTSALSNCLALLQDSIATAVAGIEAAVVGKAVFTWGGLPPTCSASLAAPAFKTASSMTPTALPSVCRP